MRKQLLEQFVRRMDHVVWKVIEGKGILLNLESGAYYEVDPVGLAIWERCDGRRTLEDIAKTIAGEFRASSERVISDSTEFILELRRRKIAEVSEKPDAALSRS